MEELKKGLFFRFTNNFKEVKVFYLGISLGMIEWNEFYRFYLHFGLGFWTIEIGFVI